MTKGTKAMKAKKEIDEARERKQIKLLPDPKEKYVTLRLSEELHLRVRMEALRSKQTLVEWVTEAIKARLLASGC